MKKKILDQYFHFLSSYEKKL